MSQVELRDVAPPVDLAPRASSLARRARLGRARHLHLRRVARETLVVDPLAPPPALPKYGSGSTNIPQLRIVVLKPGSRAQRRSLRKTLTAPALRSRRLFFREDIPKTELQFTEPGSHFPAASSPLYVDGRNETPLWLPDAARPRLRRRDDRAARRPAHLEFAVASGTCPARTARSASAPVRARHRLAR